MDYLLTILTNGRREYFERAVHAFAQHASPAPERIMVMDDGGQTGREFVVQTLEDAFPRAAWLGIDFDYEDSPAPLGMCRAHAHCWHAAASSDLPWVFHLEDDFVLLRPLDIRRIVRVLDRYEHLAQMALVRTPWGFEVPHGGYIPQTPGHYERVSAHPDGRPLNVVVGPPGQPFHTDTDGPVWIETQRNWATNPALFRTDLAREFEWPLVGGCETSIGPAIIAARGPDTRFGLWGWGEPWAAHIGEARQPGAYGYH